MSVEVAVTTEPTTVVRSTSNAATRAADVFRRCFGVGCAVLDGETGETLFSDSLPAGAALTTRGDLYQELCREVYRSGRPDFVADEDPLLALAVPLTLTGQTGCVALGMFVTRTPRDCGELSAAAAAIGLDARAVLSWAQKQPTWQPQQLTRIANMAVELWSSESRVAALEDEVRHVSGNLVTTYEEISLLYRLTQNLKLSSRDEDLGRMALEWLSEVIPAQSLALQFLPTADGATLADPGRRDALLLSRGVCPLDNAQFTQLIESLAIKPGPRAVIINSQTLSGDGWRAPGVEQLIVVPLTEGKRVFGWLAAINHSGDADFGSVEASLLGSVAAILGIHSGNVDLYRQQAEFLNGVVRALTSAIDAKDPHTCGHSDRVARVAVRLGRELGCDAQQLNTLYMSGLLHDIGKIGIDDTVLRKPGRLTDAEYEHIKAHVEIGYRILVDLKQLDQVLPVVRHHHENWDGHGYPLGLAGTQIPLLARIVAVADAFDAMSSNRPYRAGMPDHELDAVLRNGAGQQWDARVVDAFFELRDEIREISRRERDHLALDVGKWS